MLTVCSSLILVTLFPREKKVTLHPNHSNIGLIYTFSGEKGHVAPKSKPDFLDNGDPWYFPKEINYGIEWKMPLMNEICQNLEYLILNVDMFYPKHTLVPFMLYALPKIKSFGNITLVHALRMMRAIPYLKGKKLFNVGKKEAKKGTKRDENGTKMGQKGTNRDKQGFMDKKAKKCESFQECLSVPKKV